MSSDDFLFYKAISPSLYFRIGLREKGSEPRKLHTPDYDFDETGLKTGAGNMSWFIYGCFSAA